MTGASRGIGRCIALALAQNGADVALVARTRKDLKSVADELEKAGSNAVIDEIHVRRAVSAPWA